MEHHSTKPIAREPGSNFIRDIIDQDLAEGRHDRVVTRFPPEPNGYLHIGHAKAIGLNFGIALDYGRKVPARCHLRFDDTNPETEDMEYVAAIQRDVQWLGFDWNEHLYYASDYFAQLFDYAVKLIRDGKAYVDSLSEDEIRVYRGTVTQPGRESPYRNRSVEDNLDLFERMRRGEFQDGAHVLRAKIDMASPNMKLRDPLLYRIKRGAHHYRTGDAWHIYPFYDFAHPLSDAIEGITHSLCTLEFDVNRPLYDWVIDNSLEPENLPTRPHQYEFARGNLNYTVMSKRKLLRLVKEGYVAGWDDPRMPTIAGLRRRGVTPQALRTFWERMGVAKVNNLVDVGQFDATIRDDLNFRAPRVMAVLQPLKVVVTNYPEGEIEWLDAPYWPHDVPKEGSRKIPFTRELFIERDDFMEDPPKRFHRLAPGREVRLRYGYFITCDEVVKDENGEVVKLRCTYDPTTKGGDAPDGRSPKGTLHWVSASASLPCEIRLYDRLFSTDDPDAAPGDLTDHLNPDSIVTLTDARIEPSVADDDPATRYQFERVGYFWRDPVDSAPGALVFNRIVPLGGMMMWGRTARLNPVAYPGTMGPGGDTVEHRAEKPKPTLATEAPARDPLEDFTSEQRARFDRYAADLDRSDALILAADDALAAFYEIARAAHDAPQSLANWIVNELLRERKDTPLAELPFGAQKFARLVALVDAGTISNRIGKDVFAKMLKTGEDPAQIVERQGLRQVSDADVLEPVVAQVVAAFPDKVAQYRDGKTGLLGFFMGQVMRETQGKADPELAKTLLEERLLA